MSANIFYRPVEQKRYDLNVWAPSSFLASLSEAFSQFSEQKFVFNESSIPTLKGMAALCKDGGGNPYEEMIQAITKYGEIEVWPEY